MASITRLPSGSYRAEVRLTGFPALRKTHATQALAEAWAASEESRLLANRSQQLLEFPGASAYTVARAWADYAQSATHLNKAQSTQEREADSSAALLRYLGSTDVKALDLALVQSQFVDLRARDKNPRGKRISGDTLRLELALLAALITFCVQRGRLKYRPFRAGDFDAPKRGRREMRITIEQEMRLIGAAAMLCARPRANPNFVHWLTFTSDTGTRPGEAAKIKLDWISADGATVAIPRGEHKPRTPRIIVMSGHTAFAVAQQAARAREAASPYLFWSHTPTRGFMPYRYHKPFREAMKLAGIPPGFVPHGLRHETISRLVELTTLSDSQIALLVGDLHPLSLQPYKHLRAAHLRPQLSDYTSAVMDARAKILAKM